LFQSRPRLFEHGDAVYIGKHQKHVVASWDFTGLACDISEYQQWHRLAWNMMSCFLLLFLVAVSGTFLKTIWSWKALKWPLTKRPLTVSQLLSFSEIEKKSAVSACTY